MNTEDYAAFRTHPLHLLASDEAAYSTGLDTLQIFYHAHAVLRAITLVDVNEFFARELRAASAKRLPLPRRAISDFAGNASHSALVGSATRAPIPTTQKRVAQSAVHSTRRDQHRGSQASSCRFSSHSSAENTPLFLQISSRPALTSGSTRNAKARPKFQVGGRAFRLSYFSIVAASPKTEPVEIGLAARLRYSALSEAISMEKRYLTSPLSIRS